MFKRVNMRYRYHVRYVVYIYLLMVMTKTRVGAQLESPNVHFKHHVVVRPIVHHGRTKREITSTRETAGYHHKEVTVTVNLNGEDHVLDLLLNEQLVPKDHIISYQENGKTVLYRPTKEELDVCQYSGTVRDKPGSWVAVSTCRGISGVIHDGDTMKYIEPAGSRTIESTHFIYDHSDLNTTNEFDFSDVTNNTGYDPNILKTRVREQSLKQSRISRYKREAYDDTEVRGPYNANKLSRFVELVLVADHREFRANGDSVDAVHHQLKDVANIINSIYASLNIFIVLVGVVVWKEGDLIDLEEGGDITLKNFLEYRRSTLFRDIPNDNAHLITRQKFKNNVIGKGFVGSMCSYNSSGGIASNQNFVVGLVAATIAHEMGHNFNMEHDTHGCVCPARNCVMHASSNHIVPTHWSSCSLTQLALGFEMGLDYCLRNKPKRLFESPTCGNGFVEAGEQCDCGLLAASARSACAACCDPATCALRRNATCAAGACCDPATCRPRAAGSLCRAAGRECDLPEYCSGHSEYCPADVHKMDATPCGDGQAYCVGGACRSHSYQCRLLLGPAGKMADAQCYHKNVKGDMSGHCGYQQLLSGRHYTPCEPRDAMCGLLQCWAPDIPPLSNKLFHVIKDYAYGNTIIHCSTVSAELDPTVADPGLVPDGAKCGEGKMCMNQRCVLISSVTKRIARTKSKVCPSDCSGHGQCNSNGNCHCDDGFAPPLCDRPGAGGSYDSGLPTDYRVLQDFMVAMYVIFLGILPFILLILALIYYLKNKEFFSSSMKPKGTYATIIRAPKIISKFKKPLKDTQPSNGKENKFGADQHDKTTKQPEKTWIQRLTIRTEKKELLSKSVGKKLNIEDIKVIRNDLDIVDDKSIPRHGTSCEICSAHNNVLLVKTNNSASGSCSYKDATASKINNKVGTQTQSSPCNVSAYPESLQQKEQYNKKRTVKVHDNYNSELDTVIQNVLTKDAMKTTQNNINKTVVHNKLRKTIGKVNSSISNATDSKSSINHEALIYKIDTPSNFTSAASKEKMDNNRNGNDKGKTEKPTKGSHVNKLLRKFEENSN